MKNQPNTECNFYNWGGSELFPSYPKAYGARCELYDTFFIERNGKINPDCSVCPIPRLNKGLEKKTEVKNE